MQTAYETTRARLADYFERAGGMKRVAEASGIPYSTLACVMNGNRGIGRRLAMQLEDATGGEFKAVDLVWIASDASKVA